MTVGLDSNVLYSPYWIYLAHNVWWRRSGKEDMHTRSLRSGQEFVDSVPDAPVNNGMHIFFKLRLVLSVATEFGCVESDGPGHAPL